MLTNSEGETLYRWIGYEKSYFLTSLNTGLGDLTTVEQKMARFKETPDESTANILASYYDSKGEYKDAASYYNKAGKLSTDKTEDYSYRIFQAHYYGMRKEMFTLDEIKLAANDALNSAFVSAEEMTRVVYIMSNFIKDNKEDADLVIYLKQADEYLKGADEQSIKRLKSQINILQTLYVSKNVDKAVELKKASLTEGWDEEVKQLNSFSWWCFEHGINLEEAQNLARKGAELAEPGSEKATILDTLAEIVNLKGDPEGAVEVIKLAMKEAPENEYYAKQLERFNSLVK